MSAFVSHFSYEFRVGIRNRMFLLLLYLLPLGFYLMASALMIGFNPDFRETLIPAMVFFAVLTATLLGLPDPIVNAREAGVFRSYKIHGIPKFSILVIPALARLLHLLIVTIIITVTAPVLFKAELPANWLGFALSLLLMVLASMGLGLLLGVVASNSQTTVLVGQAIFLPSMMIGGLMSPTDGLPDTMGKLALLLPSTHAMNLYNVFARDLPYDINPYISGIVLCTGATLAFGLAIYLFNWDSRNQTRRGNPALAWMAALPYLLALGWAFI